MVKLIEGGPNPALLERELAVRDSQEFFGAELQVIHELVDYGTQLICRCMSSSSRELVDAFVIGTFLKQHVLLLDSLEVQLRSGVVEPAHLALRGMFEAFLNAEWMLACDTEFRALAYHRHQLRRTKHWIDRADPKTSVYRKFREDTNNVDLPDVSADVLERCRKQRVEIEAKLNDQEFEELDLRFPNNRRARTWFAPFFPENKASTAEMARQLKRYDMYVMIYEPSSEVSHATNFQMHLDVSDERAILRPLRSLKLLPQVAMLAMGVSVAFYRLVLEKCRTQELPAFAAKYKRAWRTVFLNRKDVVQPPPKHWINL